jgi:diacylglycerol kinase
MSDPDRKNKLKFSFRAAIRGMYLSFRKERNTRIHLIAAFLVTAAGLLFNITAIEWMIILLLFAMVISTEMINTAIEKLADVAEPGFSLHIRDIKDISAGAVLWTSIVSVIIGIIIFAPEILELIQKF